MNRAEKKYVAIGVAIYLMSTITAMTLLVATIKYIGS